MSPIHRRSAIPVLLIYSGYVIVALIYLIPILWVVSLSFRPLQELFAYPPRLVPMKPTWDAYVRVIENSLILTYLWNSLKLVSLSVLGTIVVALPSAYALSRFRFRSKRQLTLIMLGILMVQLISPLVTILPLYRYFATLGLINSHIVVILVFIAMETPVATWMLKGFIDTVPTALDDAARMDGASRLQSLVLVLLPVLMPGIISVSILISVATWGEFLVPYMLLSDNKLQPIGVGVLDFQNTSDGVTTHYLAAISVLATLPALIVFLLVQRFIVGDATSGAIKG